MTGSACVCVCVCVLGRVHAQVSLDFSKVVAAAFSTLFALTSLEVWSVFRRAKEHKDCCIYQQVVA